MFTGIIQTVGKVQDITRSGRVLKLIVATQDKFPKLIEGASIAINGVCLTVTNIKIKTLTFEVMPETEKKTTLARLKKGEKVNMERALRVGDELGGHIVLGHIDGTGTITSLMKGNKGYQLIIQAPSKIMSFIVTRGSIALDGVGLTVVTVARNTFSVALIPYTLAHTNLGAKKVGDTVNIEIDVIARYIKNII